MTIITHAKINQDFTVSLAEEEQLKDIAFVLFPNKECSSFLQTMSARAAEMNSELKPTLPAGISEEKPHLVNNYHVTLVHIANQNKANQTAIQKAFLHHYQHEDLKSKIVNFEITGITQTGAIANGFRWFDLNYNPNNEALIDIRKAVLEEFCPWHNGTLARMFDDPFTPAKEAQVRYCGTTFDFKSYIPHHTTHYVDLPGDRNLATNFPVNMQIPSDLQCYATDIGIGDVERNGNVAKIFLRLPLAIDESHMAGELQHHIHEEI